MSKEVLLMDTATLWNLYHQALSEGKNELGQTYLKYLSSLIENPITTPTVAGEIGGCKNCRKKFK
jgi:hypothetical protein